MSAQNATFDSDTTIENILAELPPAPAVFAPESLLVAAEVVSSLIESEPASLDFSLDKSTSDVVLQALEQSIPLNDLSGPLIPRHSHLNINRVPLQERRVDFTEMSDTWCRLVTRFDTKSDLTKVRIALGVPETFSTSRRERFTGNEALAVLLSRLAYPCRLSDLQLRWGRSETALSRCINELGELLFHQWKHLFEFRPLFYTPERLSHYAACIKAAGSPLDDIWGFIDGTIIDICRPETDQEIVYNGYKKHHALKFQAVATPDGLLGPIFGPVEVAELMLECSRCQS
ncbi:DDE family endonuclease [Rhizoctonia solani AG-3 Rhs1AP]|uniref:DDE family endonuclease n=1 Tax=Rhizoctonia solani AG-3 Rhs1AP TaxID=1086054 RepID=X8JUW2_9AGAM|nr:DDE family endonuclease [Rhizoctonia solani AG-3 Rhs1AP]